MENLINWQGLTSMGKIFWIIAIISSLAFLVMIVISLFFGDTDVDGHLEGDVSIGEGFSGFILNVKSIISFLLMFGWAGVVGMSITNSMFWVIFISFVFGIMGMIIAASILYAATKLTYSGTLDMNNAIGKTGTVVLSIPAKMNGKGQVQVIIQNSLRTLEAVTEESIDLPSGTEIQVIDITENNILKVIQK
jgi:hypothetical protein